MRRLLNIQWFRFAVVFVAALFCGRTNIGAQEPFATVYEITAAQRLALEQIDQLVVGDQVDAAVELIVRTMDEADGRLVAVPRGSEVANDFIRFVPLDFFLQDRLMRWGVSRPEILSRYRKLSDSAAEVRLKQITAGSDFRAAFDASRRLLATSFGDDALLAAADAALERGWNRRAISLLRRIDPRWQAVEEGANGQEVRGFGWELMLPRLDGDAFDAMEVWWKRQGAEAGLPQTDSGGWPLGCYVGSDLPAEEVGVRLLIAYAGVGETETVERLGRLLKSGFSGQAIQFSGEQTTVEKVLEARLPELLRRSRAVETAFLKPMDAGTAWPMSGRDAARVYRTGALGEIGSFPSWVRELDVGFDDAFELPDEPAVGWANLVGGAERTEARTIRTPPVMLSNLVFAQKGSHVFGMDVSDGTSWPEGNPNAWFYQHVEATGLRPASGIMPVDGQPWFALAVEGGRLAARFGPSGSGWLQSVRPDIPLSEIVLMDVEREGQVPSGYPVRARSLMDSRQSLLVEFEGVPLVVGRRMFVGLTRRDDATLTSSLACYDVASGQLLYESKLLSSARPLPAMTANRVAGSQVSYSEGVVYYHGDSGAIVALDAEAGDLLWLVRYPRAELDNSAYPRRRRAKGVRMSPVALLGGLAIAGPSDLDRLMAIDAFDGSLVWATGESEADDVDQVLGEVGGQIIVGGDSLYRLDRATGAVMDRWPAGTTQQIHGALPQPRRQGRGLMAGEMVYWPTSDSIWVFDASSFSPLQRVDLRAIGMVGGDLAAADGMLVIADGNKVAAFEGDVADKLATATKSD